MYFDYLFIIDIIVYLVSDDQDINSKQVVYSCFNFYLERMSNHLKIRYVLSPNILECLENSSVFLYQLYLVK